MAKMTSGSARRWPPGMTTVDKHDIQHIRPSDRNKLRKEGFTWSEIKKIDDAVGKGERTLVLKSSHREVTSTLSPRWR
ncbi:hypothetical protein [Streptacidiphilus sp. MAP5-3]|uniref:hypothetical protein n=1 Tax=unclassified Streptacidiphilus TaxID=2643834 RepID=UPI0035151713